ncbi:MAG: tyrosine-type recombinase/integrase [Chloroflexota bacterium]
MALEPLPTHHIKPSATRLDASLTAFLLDRESARYTAQTLRHYRYGLGSFVAYLKEQGITTTSDIKPSHIRSYLVGLERRGLKDTTQHVHARTIKTWLRWLVAEGELGRSPMQTVKMPKLEQRIPSPFTVDDIQRLLAACERQTPRGARDYAIVLSLLDSGLRAAEFTSLKIGDLDMRSGLVTVIGKGRKQRQVRLGAKARAAIIRMLGYRGEVARTDPLWTAYSWDDVATGPLSQHGLRSVLQRLGKNAGVMPCSPHRFRRTFALWCLRDGMDIYDLAHLMGHSSLAVLQRYLALGGEDVERVHRAHSPADRLLEGRSL